MLNIKPTILKGTWVQLEPLNESHKNELYDAAQDEAIWTYTPKINHTYHTAVQKIHNKISEIIA